MDIGKINRQELINIQKDILEELQQKLTTEDLYFLNFCVDDGSRSGHNVASTSERYLKCLKTRERTEKIRDIYNEVNLFFCGWKMKNEPHVRDAIREMFLAELGEDFEVKCDLENNTVDIIDDDCCKVDLQYDRQLNGSSKKFSLVFGEPDKAQKYLAKCMPF